MCQFADMVIDFTQRCFRLWLWGLFCVVTMGAFASQAHANQRVFGKSEEESFKGKVVIIKVGDEDLANKHAFKFWRRVIERVNEEKATAVLFEIDTPGGLAFDTAELIMVQMQKLEVPSYSFVNQKALSAGALVASGTDHIYMHPVSAIGAAALVSGNGAQIDEVMRSKIESAFDAFVRTVTESKGHNADVLRAMMFREREFEFGPIKVEKGELLSLTGTEATRYYQGKPLLAKGTVKTIEELLEKEGLGDVEMIRAEPTGMEKFAYWTTAMSAVLILVGIGGAYLEMKTPGFGLGGGISLLSFGLFFFGNYAAGNMAGYGLMVLFVIGAILLIVEFFVLPGMVVPGILGAIMVLASLFLAMVDEFAFEDNDVQGWDSANAWDFIQGPSLALLIGLSGSMILIALSMRFLPNVPIFNKLVMSKELSNGAAMDEPVAQGERAGLAGKATTDLRPAGKGVFDGEVLDVTAANGFITSGQDIVITEEDGMRILVKIVD